MNREPDVRAKTAAAFVSFYLYSILALFAHEIVGRLLPWTHFPDPVLNNVGAHFFFALFAALFWTIAWRILFVIANKWGRLLDFIFLFILLIFIGLRFLLSVIPTHMSFYYRQCTVRRFGEITECGWTMLLADTAALVICAIVAFTVYRIIVSRIFDRKTHSV